MSCAVSNRGKYLQNSIISNFETKDSFRFFLDDRKPTNQPYSDSIDNLFDAYGYLIKDRLKLSNFDMTYRFKKKVEDLESIEFAISSSTDLEEFYSETYDNFCLIGWYSTLKDKTYDRVTVRVLNRMIFSKNKKASFRGLIKFIDEIYSKKCVKQLQYLTTFTMDGDPFIIKEKIVSALEVLVDNKKHMHKHQIIYHIRACCNEWQLDQSLDYLDESFDKFFDVLINRYHRIHEQ